MTLMIFIWFVSLIRLLFILWLEMTNPQLLESASAHDSIRQLRHLRWIYCHAGAFTRCQLPIHPFST